MDCPEATLVGMVTTRTCIVIALLSVSGCLQSSSSDGPSAGADGASGSGAGMCQDLAGDWMVTEHCDASFVGTASTLTQTGCDYVAVNGDFNCPGTITMDGDVAHDCTGPNGDISCIGTVSGDIMSLDCGDCIVTSVRQ